jgi:peptide deformylase
MKHNILQKDEPVLRAFAEPVQESEFGTKELLKQIEAMSIALHGEDDGVAIAAPQIGISKRIFIVSGRTLGMLKSGKSFEELSASDHLKDMVFVNPEIQKLSKKKTLLEEGCLSVRWLYGKVERSEKARIRAHDENGRGFTVDASGLLAQIFQHETDHLNGVLFIDKAKDLEDLPPQDSKDKDKTTKHANQY